MSIIRVAAGLVLACVSFGSIAQQKAPQSVVQQTERWVQDFAHAQGRRQEFAGTEWYHSFDRQSRKHIHDLPIIRKHLAGAWQHFGMSPAAARAVADAYVIEEPNLADPPTIRGRTDEEVASMLQAAIRGGHYLRANELLIQYERRRLHIPPTPRA